jgi:hypothetical protein
VMGVEVRQAVQLGSQPRRCRWVRESSFQIVRDPGCLLSEGHFGRHGGVLERGPH